MASHTNHQSVAAVLPGARIADEVVPPASSAPIALVRGANLQPAADEVATAFHREALSCANHNNRSTTTKETRDAKYALHPQYFEHLNRRRRLERMAQKGAGHQPFLTINDKAPSESVADEISDLIQNDAERTARSRAVPFFRASCMAWAVEPAPQAHAATRNHEAVSQ